MAIRLLLFILFSSSFAFAQTSYDICKSIPSDVRILNESGGLNPDGSDGVTLLVDRIGRVQMFRKGISQGQVYYYESCPSSYGLYVTVSDAQDNILLAGSPNRTLASVSYSAVTGTGTDSDPYIATTVVTLQSAGYFTGGNEVITITDKAYGNKGVISRSIEATGLDPNLIYRFSYYLDTYFSGNDEAYAYKQGTIPGTENLIDPMPMQIGAIRGDEMMVLGYGGGEPYTSYFSGLYRTGGSDLSNGYDLSNTISSPSSLIDNGFGIQWKVQGKTSLTIRSSDMEYKDSAIPSSIVFSPPEILVGEESTVSIEISAIGKTITGDNPMFTLDPSLAFIPNSLSMTCDSSTMTAVTEALNGNVLTVVVDGGLNMPVGDTCTIQFKVIGKRDGIAKLTNMQVAGESLGNNNAALKVTRALGSETSSIPSSNLLSLLIMILSLSGLVGFKRQRR